MKRLSLLFIGNSFSDDTIQDMYRFAKDFDYEVKIENLYIGGCSIEQHYNNTAKHQPAYLKRFWHADKWESLPNSTIEETIRSYDWDYISLQQASHYSGIEETYKLLPNLIEEIKNI